MHIYSKNQYILYNNRRLGDVLINYLVKVRRRHLIMLSIHRQFVEGPFRCRHELCHPWSPKFRQLLPPQGMGFLTPHTSSSDHWPPGSCAPPRASPHGTPSCSWSCHRETCQRRQTRSRAPQLLHKSP